MAYQIYTTDALILKRIPYDNNVSYLLFTKDFGLISALATGVRKSESKLRYALQEYSLCQISLVKGRSTWRITSATLELNFYLHAKMRASADVIARISTQIIRLVAGQEKDEQLFDMLIAGFKELAHAPSDMIAPLEILIMLRSLHLLGYVSEVDTSVCMPYAAYDAHVLEIVSASKTNFIGHINKGLRESQL